MIEPTADEREAEPPERAGQYELERLQRRLAAVTEVIRALAETINIEAQLECLDPYCPTCKRLIGLIELAVTIIETASS